MLRKLMLVLTFLALCLFLSLTDNYLGTKPHPSVATTNADDATELFQQALTDFKAASVQTAYGLSQTSADTQYETAEQLLASPQGPWLHKLYFESSTQTLTEHFGLENEMEQFSYSPGTYSSLLAHPLLCLAAPTEVEVIDQLVTPDQEILILSYKDPASNALLGKTKDQQVLVRYHYQIWLQVKPKLSLYKSINFWTHKNPGGLVNTASELYLETTR